MTTIRCKTVQTNLKRGGRPVSGFVLLHNGIFRDDAVYTVVSQKSSHPLPLVKATHEMVIAEIKEMLKHGYRVELPEMLAFLSIPGSVESAFAESSRATPPKLVATLPIQIGTKAAAAIFADVAAKRR